VKQRWWQVDRRMEGGEGRKEDGERNGGRGGLRMMALGLIVVVGNVIVQCHFETFGCRMQLCVSSGVCWDSVFNVFPEE